MLQKALNRVLTLPKARARRELSIGVIYVTRASICVELRPFYCGKRNLVPMSYNSFWDFKQHRLTDPCRVAGLTLMTQKQKINAKMSNRKNDKMSKMLRWTNYQNVKLPNDRLSTNDESSITMRAKRGEAPRPSLRLAKLTTRRMANRGRRSESKRHCHRNA